MYLAYLRFIFMRNAKEKIFRGVASHNDYQD